MTRASASSAIGADELDAAERAGLLTVAKAQRWKFVIPLCALPCTTVRPRPSGTSCIFHSRERLTVLRKRNSGHGTWLHAAITPDARIADELERAAERARIRSGRAAAASALERAARAE